MSLGMPPSLTVSFSFHSLAFLQSSLKVSVIGEAQRGEVTNLKSPRQQKAELQLIPKAVACGNALAKSRNDKSKTKTL